MRIGYLGVGNMGQPMAENSSAPDMNSGFSTWARTQCGRFLSGRRGAHARP